MFGPRITLSSSGWRIRSSLGPAHYQVTSSHTGIPNREPLGRQRCYLLELPAELRLRIYEEIALQQRPNARLTVLSPRCKGTHDFSHPITRVSRTIRWESIPIFYRGLTIVFDVGTTVATTTVNKWCDIIDEDALASIQIFWARTCSMNQCAVVINLANLEDPVSVYNQMSCCGDMVLEHDVDGMIEERILDLEIVNGKRAMTKVVLRELADKHGCVSKSVVMAKRRSWGRN